MQSFKTCIICLLLLLGYHGITNHKELISSFSMGKKTSRDVRCPTPCECTDLTAEILEKAVTEVNNKERTVIIRTLVEENPEAIFVEGFAHPSDFKSNVESKFLCFYDKDMTIVFGVKRYFRGPKHKKRGEL